MWIHHKERMLRLTQAWNVRVVFRQRNKLFVFLVWDTVYCCVDRYIPGVERFEEKAVWNSAHIVLGFPVPWLHELQCLRLLEIFVRREREDRNLNPSKKTLKAYRSHYCIQMTSVHRTQSWFVPNCVRVSVWVRLHLTRHAWLTADRYCYWPLQYLPYRPICSGCCGDKDILLCVI